MFPMTVVNRDKTLPRVAIAIVVINVLVFLWEMSIDAQGKGLLDAALKNYGLEVCQIGVQSFGTTVLDTFRSLFLHQSAGHLLGNMWFLFLFGGLVEKFIGSVKFVGLYIALGYLATITHVVFGNTICTTANTGVIIGASGAIAGVMGAFLFLYPSAKVRTLVGLIKPFTWSINIPAFMFLGYWLTMDILSQIGWLGVTTNVAHWAHIGGFLAGFAILFVVGFFKPVPKADPLEHLLD